MFTPELDAVHSGNVLSEGTYSNPHQEHVYYDSHLYDDHDFSFPVTRWDFSNFRMNGALNYLQWRDIQVQKSALTLPVSENKNRLMGSLVPFITHLMCWLLSQINDITWIIHHHYCNADCVRRVNKHTNARLRRRVLSWGHRLQLKHIILSECLQQHLIERHTDERAG